MYSEPYNELFGLSKNPFSMTPDPSFLFMTEQHRSALAGLTYAIFQRKFVVLTGEAGTGKTTLLSRVLHSLPANRFQFSLILNPTLTPNEFLELALLDFGMKNIPSSKAQRLWMLRGLLLEGQQAGKVSALVVDEAHKLTAEVLEEIRLLGNFEAEDQKLLQIVLVGQGELDETLDRDELRQLKQRIAVRLLIGPLTPQEVGPYIRHRWSAAGGSELPFSEDAVTAIAVTSSCIPRIINALCDNALLQALAGGSDTVNRGHVQAAAADLQYVQVQTSHDQDEVEPDAADERTDNEVDVERDNQPGPSSSSRFQHWIGRLGLGRNGVSL
jgi:general secretion pathway protein A